MTNYYHAIIEKDGDWFISYCPEFPGANGLGKTLDECKQSLKEAITLIIQDRIEDAMKSVPTY